MRIGLLIDPRFQDVVRRLQTAHIPLKAAYKLKGIVKSIDEEINKYEELRKSAVEKYGRCSESGDLEKDEHGNVLLNEDQGETFRKEINDLINLDVPMSKVSMKDLGEKVTLSVEDLYFIEELLED